MEFFGHDWIWHEPLDQLSQASAEMDNQSSAMLIFRHGIAFGDQRSRKTTRGCGVLSYFVSPEFTPCKLRGPFGAFVSRGGRHVATSCQFDETSCSTHDSAQVVLARGKVNFSASWDLRDVQYGLPGERLDRQTRRRQDRVHLGLIVEWLGIERGTQHRGIHVRLGHADGHHH